MVSKNNPCFFLCSNSIRMPCPWRQIKKKSAGVNREGDWEKPVSQNHMRGKSYRQTDGGNLVPFMSPGIGFPSLMLWQAKTEAQRQGMGVEEEKLEVGEQCCQEPGVGVYGGLAVNGLWVDGMAMDSLH